MPYRRPYLGDFERAQREHPDWPVVLSEGDSWFSFADVVGRLDDPLDRGTPRHQRAWALLRLERSGDEILTILSGPQRAKLRDYFGRWRLDAVLFSAGGNDLVGADLLPLVRDYVPGAAVPDLVAFSRFERRLRQIQDGYRELLDLMRDGGQEAKLFVNSYDYVRPSEQGAAYVGPFRARGPWIQPALEARGIPRRLWPAVVRFLIDAFAAALDGVAAEPATAGRLVRVETRGAVGDRFRDELHPDREGARRVAERFARALRRESVLRP